MSNVSKELDDILQHHGVKGMKWGIRGESSATRKRLGAYNKGIRLMDRIRLKKMTSSEARKEYLDNKDKEWIAKVKDDKNIHKVSARTTKEFKRLNKEIKDQFGGRGLAGEARRAINGSLNAAYHKTMKDAYEMVLSDQTFSVYKLSPSRTREVHIVPNPDGTLKATVVERQNPKLTKQRNAINKAANKIKHAASDEEDDVSMLDGMSFIILPDEDGFPDEVIPALDESDDVQHSGVKGMKWRQTKTKDLSVSEDVGAGGSGESTDPLEKSKDDLAKTEAQLDDIGARIEALKSKTGNSPLEMLKNIIIGKPKSVVKGKVVDMEDLGKRLKNVKGIVGSGPKDMLKYLITGKKKIQHSGVMGMKWGVHRAHNRPGGADGKFSESEKIAKTALGKKWNSLKRERQWHSVLKQVEHMSNVDISKVTKRLSLENSLKRLTRSKVATKKDKEDYLRRSHMDDQELSRKIARLSLKDGLHKAVHEASKQQREFGKKVVNIGGSLGTKYVLNRVNGSGTLGLDDVIKAFNDPKGSAAEAKKDAKAELIKRGKAHANKINPGSFK